MRLSDRVCVVTGGTSGIGLAVVRLFARHGATQLVVSLDPQGCADLDKEAERAGWPLRTIVGDVGDPATWDRVRRDAAALGVVEVLVNNAGYGIQASVPETSEQDWAELFRTNVTGVFLGCRAMLPQMVANGRGSIVTVGSVAGQIGMARRAAYCASKAAVVGLTKAMAVDHGRDGIRVNVVAPGTTDSPYFAKIAADVEDPAAYRAYLAGRQLMNRLGTPDEIAEAVLFLAGDASSFATGSVLTVDGGMSVA